MMIVEGEREREDEEMRLMPDKVMREKGWRSEWWRQIFYIVFLSTLVNLINLRRSTMVNESMVKGWIWLIVLQKDVVARQWRRGFRLAVIPSRLVLVVRRALSSAPCPFTQEQN